MAARGTICKFFAQGNCRYGNTCWNEHSSAGQGPGGGRGFGGNFGGSSRYKLDNRFNAISPQTSSTGPSNSDIIDNIGTEMETWEKSKMWLFSSFFYTKEAPPMPGFDDISPEELRHEAYLESPKHHLQLNYKNKERQLTNDVCTKIAKLKKPDDVTKQQLNALIELSKHGASLHTTPVSNAFTGASPPNPPTKDGSTGSKNMEETIAAIANEVNTWEKSGMWLLSEYCSNKESPSVPGFNDISFEELRHEAYSENQKVHLQVNYKMKERQLMNDARMKIAQLKNLDPATKQQLAAFLAAAPGKTNPNTASAPNTNLFGKSSENKPAAFGGTSTITGNNLFAGGSNKPAAPFGGATSTSPFSSSSVFGSASSSPSPFGAGVPGGSAFGGTNNSGLFSSSTSSSGLFGKPADPNQSAGLFGKPADPNQSVGLFGKPAAFGAGQTAGLFGNPAVESTPSSSGLFGKGNAVATQGSGLFGNTGGQTTSFGQSVGLFGKPSNSSQSSANIPGSIFGQASGASVFGKQSDSATAKVNVERIYTPIEELTEEEKKEFEAEKFTLGRIPTRPPAKEYV